MDARLKADWIAALRSGEYQQGTGHFERDDGKFCCLGVLCKVAGQPTQSERGVSNWSFVKDAIGESEGLPEGMHTLARMNDAQKKSFVEIADFIEANL